MPFQPGQSGNPAGRPIGARNRKTLLMEALLEGDGEDLTRCLIEKALSGDATAMKLCMERLLPRMRERPIPFPLPRLASPADVRKAAAEIQGAVEVGALTPREALDLLRVVDKLVHTIRQASSKNPKNEKPQPRLMHLKWQNSPVFATLERQPDGMYRTIWSDRGPLGGGNDDVPNARDVTPPKGGNDDVSDALCGARPPADPGPNK
jgi:hypothetical protein